MRQPFAAFCCSGTSASTARANTSDIQVLVSVPRPLARFFNAPYIYRVIQKKRAKIKQGTGDAPLNNLR